MKKKIRYFAIFTLLAIFEASASMIDEHTLFYAGFEKNTSQADYAVGPSLFSGTGASLTDGYRGHGLQITQLPLTIQNIEKCSDTVLGFRNWGPLLDGNIRPEGGTMELFFRLGKGFSGLSIIPHIARNVYNGKTYTGFQLSVNQSSLSYLLPVWGDDSTRHISGRITFREISDVKRNLGGGWHHLALCWESDKAAIYLDGRLLESFEFPDGCGLAIMNNAREFFSFRSGTIDEFRISDIVRYTGNFEPEWDGGKRPDYAFSGNSAAKLPSFVGVVPPRPEIPIDNYHAEKTCKIGEFELRFSSTGQLLAASKETPSGHGLIVHQGLNRQLLIPQKANFKTNEGIFEIAQEFSNGLHAVSHLIPDSGLLRWEIEFHNRGTLEALLETVLNLPFDGLDVTEYFDGLEARRDLRFPRYRDSYPYVMPLAAVSGANRFLFLGLDPNFPYNDLIHGFHPGKNGYFQQGTRLALSPGEKFTVKFIVGSGQTEFGTLSALDAYYRKFADLYKLNPEYTIYNYLPHTSHRRGLTCEDILRTGYAGSMWGHGPYHTKGDEVGKWWNMTKYLNNPSYKHALGWEKVAKSPERLREMIAVEYKMEYDHGYPLRRYHTCPNLTPEWIIQEVQPGYRPKDDMLVSGHYYNHPTQTAAASSFFTNEYNTALGEHMRLQAKEYYEYGLKDVSPGWINDVTYAVAHFRFNDTSSPGRSFARDKGTFIRGAMGLQKRNDLIKSLPTRNSRSSMSWDNGCFSFTTGAHSTSSAIESGSIFETLIGHSFVPYARNLHGQKPIMAHTFTRGIRTGEFLQSGDITDMSTVRKYFRDASRKLVLFCLKNGVQLDPTGYLFGNQYLMEMTPLMIDSVTRGHEIIPGGHVDKPFFLHRSGSALSSLVIAGNDSSRPQKSSVKLLGNYWNHRRPLPFAYFGGKLSGALEADGTVLPLELPEYGVLAVNTLMALSGDAAGRYSSEINSNGITVRAVIELAVSKACQLHFRTEIPLYRPVALELNGRKVPVIAGLLDLPAGENRIILEYRAIDFAFNEQDWNAIEFFKNGHSNYRLVADKGWKIMHYSLPLGFEFGTASLFKNFAIFYDWEDGILDNLTLPEIIETSTPGYDGWEFRFEKASERSVRINREKRIITICGTTPGEIRRASMALLRLMDRKYPHIGPFYPLKSSIGIFDRKTGPDFSKMIDWRNNKADKPSATFFANLPEQDFLFKPLLNREYDESFSKNLTDFTGTYQMKTPVFLFEPTYEDDFVYGYTSESSEWQKRRNEAQDGGK